MSQTDPALLQKIQQHTEKCLLLFLTPTKPSPTKTIFCSCFSIWLTIINSSELTKRCLSKYCCFHYQESLLPSHFAESIKNSHCYQQTVDKIQLNAYVTGTDLQPYTAATAMSLQYQAASFACLSMKPLEANYLAYVFVSTAFRSLHNASDSQKENCSCQWSLPTTRDACSSLIQQFTTFTPQ